MSLVLFLNFEIRGKTKLQHTILHEAYGQQSTFAPNNPTKKKLIPVVFEVFSSFPKILAQEKSKCKACEGKRSSNKTAKKDPFYTTLNWKD